MRKKSKLVVTFDSEKRKEYLTGFHKRKQERRRYGLDMEAYKVKKLQLEAKKNRRAEHKEKLAALNLLSDDEQTKDAENEDEDEDEDEESEASESERACASRTGEAKAVVNVTTFSDDFTQKKFGDVVTVTTAVGDLQSDSDDSDSSLEAVDDATPDTEDPRGSRALRPKKRKVDPEQHLTLFQRIQQQRKGKALPSKRSKLKEARTARKTMMGKKGNSSGAVGRGKKRGAEDGDGGGGTAVGKLKKKLKMKRSQSSGQKRQKKR